MSIQTQSELLLLEAFDLISGTTVFGVIFGITFVLYCLCARSLYHQLQEPEKRRQAQFTLGYISFLLFCATGLLVLNTGITQLAYITHADSPGGPLGYEGSFRLTTNVYDIAGGILQLILEVSTVAIQVSY